MINGMFNGKFSCNLKQYCWVTSLIKSFNVAVRTKAHVFSALDISKFEWTLRYRPLYGYCLAHILCGDHELENRDVRVYSSWCLCDPCASKAGE